MRTARAHRVRLAAASLAAIAGIASAPLAFSALGGGETTAIAAAMKPAERLMALLDARSPGERQKGELSKTKIKTAARVSGKAPPPRALGKVFPPKPSPLEQLAKVVVASPPPPVAVAVAPPPTIADVITPAAVLPSVPIQTAGLIASFAPIGGGGFIGGAPPPVNNVAVVPPVPPVSTAVPEPGTWLMMLLGFGVIGSTVSRRRPNRALSTAS